MTAPLPESVIPAALPVTRSPQRVKLVRTWANSLGTSAYIPLEPAEFELRLTGVVDRMVDVLTRDPFSSERAHEDGGDLVRWGCTGPESLQITMEVLDRGLPALPELPSGLRFAERLVLLLGALAAGYTEQVRIVTLEQQESMSQALLKSLNETLGRMRSVEAEFDDVLENSVNGIALTDREGAFLRANERLADILGYAEGELAGSTLFDLVLPEESKSLRDGYAALVAGAQRRVHSEQRLVRKDGDNAWAAITMTAPASGDPGGRFVVVVEDRTELNLLHGQLNHQALHDMLTRLPNRQFFSSSLERIVRHAAPSTGITLYHLNLDAFSLITHGLGRRVGDLLLDSVAHRLESLFAREKAMVARFGADEFAVLVENSPTTPDAVSTVRMINEVLAEPVYLDGHAVASPASIGVVDRPPAGLDAASLLEAAEMSLARAKRNGRTQWALFDPYQDARDREMFSLAVSLPGAWENGELSVEHRPLVRLDGGEVVGLDALLSWQHPYRGRLPHARCAELAEQTGLILPLGNWLLGSACAAQARTRLEGLDDGTPLHVGLTPNQSSDPDLLSRVLGVLDDTGLPANRLWLGIPASALAQEGGEAAENLRLLASAGVATEILDFSTTGGDLAHLEDLPVRAVRIARWMVRRQAQDVREDSLVALALKEILRIVHGAGTTVIVDGVDTEGQADRWRRLGADLAQGEFTG
ncbi:EAL domain-containing protein [Umezawaea sp. Da 62-37]|uniref:putative bifunctional diguanylate cyclase/phosphodiesterase n=1 Tax=Umezawaea sp. Da 62-37 TaxID=3075927 RepID=UPI0028F727A7|nr:EAL domain-containing protein [Umezawaea sp. Da 62-37]WNV90400.1 EAL domain-containing protein [Umezawaea sp. Da 62-37]